jgi:thiol-disulfide isomerase/thioredoxin
MMKKIQVHMIAVLLLLGSFSRAQETPPSASQVLETARQQAGKENKKIFLMFHASWCGWCHKMDDAMNDPAIKKFFTDNFLIKHLVVYEAKDKKQLENPGAEDFLKEHAGADQGIPMWYVIDADGRVLADSQVRPEGVSMDQPGKNTGCPASKEEVEYFIKVLQQTTKLKPAELEKIAVRFRKNG